MSKLTIPRRPAGRPAPLSFSQHRLWYLDQLDPDLPTYNMPFAFRLSGQLDLDALRRSLDRVADRHEVLRTAFVADGENPVQQIAPGAGMELTATAAASEEALSELLHEVAHRPFDLASGPPFRVALFQLSADEHVLLVVAHHSAFDGWSISILMREVGALYESFAAGKEDALPELPIQFSDYAEWQREQVDQPAVDKQREFWSETLGGRLPVLEIPTDRPRPATQSFAGDWEELAFSPELCEKLKSLQRSERVTSFMLLLAGFNALLHRYTGEEDLIVGSPVANRNRAEIEGLIGFFVNNLALRVDHSGDPSFRELLARVRRTCLGAYKNQEIPFERLVETLNPERDLSRTPVFQVMFDVHRAPAALELPGLTVTPYPYRRRTSHFDLTLFMRESADGLLAMLNYNTDLYDASTMRRFLEHFHTLLEAAVADPDATLSAVDILGEEEKQRSLVAWNATEVDYDLQSTVHAAFEAQARKTPDATAVVFRDESLTYRELDTRANQLAHRLQALGVGPDRLVGIAVDRSIEMMVALLGTLKAGGAYLPLDPNYPKQRLAFMLEDADVPVLLTQKRLMGQFPEHQSKVVTLDTDWPSIAKHPTEAPESASTAEHLAYVMYTSGSTGKPKGVMITHRNLINFFVGMDDRVGGDDPGSWLALTSINFDISVLELFWTLCRGFKVVVQSHSEWTRSELIRTAHPDKAMQFSLFYFAANEGAGISDKYRLLIEGAKLADGLGFDAVWTPERHFEAFGGLYPNPSVAAAAIATVTRNIKIRAGSCVLPLHDPIRVAEEWSLVDNLSNGRVGIALASGWHDRDFVFFPDRFQDRKNIMFENLKTLHKLWAGEKITRTSGAGKEIEVGLLPKPVQQELPIWITASGSPETFSRAGASGSNILTHLLGQSVEELATKIDAYNKAWNEAGHAPGQGVVTLMLHTYIGEDGDAVREEVRAPFTAYLRTAVGLFSKLAEERGQTLRDGKLTDEDMDALLEHAFNRYYETSALFGTRESCMEMVDKLKSIGVSEIAALIDFGIDEQRALDGIPRLAELMHDANPGQTEDDDSIAAQIDKHAVTHLQCTPSMAGMLLATAPEKAALGKLKRMMVGGEALSASLAEQLRGACKGQISNMYGPTETTIWSSTSVVGDGEVTLGRPIANTQLYVLSPQLQPAPIGVPGELHIGGDGVALGYLGRPELTQERFIRNPFSDDPEARIYKTGDLVRYRADGSLEFLGRIDHQVKIRGHRVELGEIEAMLARHQSIREAVTLVREDVPGDKRLVGYLRLLEGTELETRELQGWLRQGLPEIMIPSAFVILDSFPQTPNGKIDRKALPAPDLSQQASSESFVEPETPVEKTVSQIWRELLGVDRIGAHDNFFELGGHSLSAVQLGMRLKQTYMIDVPLRSLFEAPTVSAIAGLVGSMQPKADRISEIMQQVQGMSSEEASEALGGGSSRS